MVTPPGEGESQAHEARCGDSRQTILGSHLVGAFGVMYRGLACMEFEGFLDCISGIRAVIVLVCCSAIKEPLQESRWQILLGGQVL